MKKFFFFLALFLLLTSYFLPQDVFASSKNIFGLHLTQPSDLTPASKIINSSNGDWGWVTIVIRTNQLDRNVWQDFFDQCRTLHLIPIVRLATIVDGSNWKKPDISDIDNLASFLNSLNWPTTTQHLILFNEINHAAEWGGILDPKGYADLSLYAIDKFKSLNSNFFILSSGLDLASPDLGDFMSASTIYQQIYAYKPEYFDKIDGIASHSYPNHGFIGTPADTGQHSIRGYIWELNYLKKLGVTKDLPIFITETGWPHREGIDRHNGFYTTDTTAKFLATAFKIWGEDPRIKAVTPFIFNYPSVPFDHFSWLDSDEKMYPSYQTVIDLPKPKNTPEQTTTFEVVQNILPFLITPDTETGGRIILKNTGQSIWGETLKTTFCLNPQSTQNVTLDAICTSNDKVLPGQTASFDYKLKIDSSADKPERTIIGWIGLPEYEITPLNSSATIYSPKDNLFNFIIRYFKSLFI
ncbi:hypothetical protein KBC75_03185 [Candidatus Shapirobacteria bacterium]|nr:hypothetical protein [Candidatus Shapirobacteria bacterium]